MTFFVERSDFNRKIPTFSYGATTLSIKTLGITTLSITMIINVTFSMIFSVLLN
jgi:hypothetical protein